MQTSYNGAVESTFTSLPFGDGYTANGSDSDPYRFAMLDKDYDGGSDSGTDHATFRQYSDTQGRWMSPDPYSGSYDVNDPQSMNRYTYVLNNPLAYVDPDGTSGDCPENQLTGSSRALFRNGCKAPDPPPPPDPCDSVDCYGDPGPNQGEDNGGGGGGGGAAPPAQGTFRQFQPAKRRF